MFCVLLILEKPRPERAERGSRVREQPRVAHQLRLSNDELDKLVDQIDTEVDSGKRIALIRRAEDIMEQDPPLAPVAWEYIFDVWHNYVKGHNPKDYFGIYDVVRFDT